MVNLQAQLWTYFLVNSNSLLKVTAFLLTWVIVWLPIGIPCLRILKVNQTLPLTTEQKLPILITLYLIAPLIVWGATLINQETFADYGLNWQPHLWQSLILGISMAYSSLILIFLVEGWLGWLQWHPENIKNFWSILLPLFGLGLAVGLIEELIFRGLFINQLTQDYSYLIAATISSLIFAFLHLIWEREKTRPQLPGLWLMAMVLVQARWVDGGSLGLAWGLHAGWIWGLSSLSAAGLMSYTGKVSSWLTGLNNEPLAGLAGIVCMLGTSLILWYGF